MPQRSDAPDARGQFVSLQPQKAVGQRKPPGRWELEATAILRGEMQRRGYTYKKLVLALERQGVQETERRLISRIRRGTFGFAFALKCFRAMGVDRVGVGPV